MRLATKLVIMSFFSILIPMLIIVFFSVFMIYQSNAISQWEYLESVASTIERDVAGTESNYLKIIKTAASTQLLSDKLYVYEKYWNALTENLIAYDLEPLNDFIQKLAHNEKISVVSVYRRYKDVFNPVAGHGENQYLPAVLYKDLVQTDYNKAVYRRYPDGIYLDVIYPVFSDGKLVGLIQFMRGFNEEFLQEYAKTFDIDFALVSKNALMLNSAKTTDTVVMNILDEENTDLRSTFRSGSSTYSGIVVPFNLGGDAIGDLMLYSERANLFGGESFLMQRMLALTLLCILIPVITFFIKEIRLIKSINSLLAATDAISAGNYITKVKDCSNDELGMLSRNFNKMVIVLKKNREDLEAQNNELALKNSYIDAVFQSLRINIIVLDPDLKIQVVSKNAGSRLELSVEHYGKELLSIEPFHKEEKLLRKTLENVFNVKSFTRLYSVKFENISYEMDFYPVVGDDHSISAIVLILNNITEQMNMSRALIQSDKLASVGKMAAGLAHEINNPMSIILNHVQLLQSDRLMEDEKGRFINRIESEIKRVSKLINNLLKFSREDKLQPENVDLGEIFSEVIGLFDPKASAEHVEDFYDGYNIISRSADKYNINFKDRKIVFYISDQLKNGVIFCGRDSLKQVLFNIIKNAFESCGEDDGIIRTNLEKVSEGVKIIVSDNGCGIEDENLEKVFDIFYTKGKPGTGAGLGLPLCKRLMNNIGGEIYMISKNGKGVAVTLVFPDREVFYG